MGRVAACRMVSQWWLVRAAVVGTKPLQTDAVYPPLARIELTAWRTPAEAAPAAPAALRASILFVIACDRAARKRRFATSDLDSRARFAART